MSDFQKVAVLGGGLLGGSLAMAVRPWMDVSLWVRRAEAIGAAFERGIEVATTDMAVALDGADLVILSVPVGAMRGLAAQAIDSGLSKEALVSDVGSVKQVVHRELGGLLGEAGFGFIGGHPMAGSERRGLEAADANLFRNAACLLTDDGAVGQPQAGRLQRFWEDVGCVVRWTEAAVHDELVARISHFPHVMAAATALVALDDPEDAMLGGGGLRDTTRVAGGDPAMWAEILTENREAVGAAIRPAVESLRELLVSLENADHDAVRAWLERAQSLHAAARPK